MKKLFPEHEALLNKLCADAEYVLFKESKVSYSIHNYIHIL
ncbi:unnamed protein product [Schistosoma curassoni]|uniref:Transcriptional regulator n=1 Tax=Schistosoma curassoni TaxID=6186 RepID=A0A183L2C8_9TREM|nr:unnamed protein product [Schistosoma curassoni]